MDIVSRIKRALINEDRYQLLIQGLGNTLLIVLLAILLGVIIGLIIATIKVKKRTSLGGKIAELFADIYLTLIRGTPITVQLLITYFIIFASINSDYRLIVAALAFGLNSGAYTAEIIRGGILAVEKGQTEAGRSLGLSPFQTMRYIVLPQALKNALPALCNEVISLLKETSVAGFIGAVDVTQAAMLIRAATYDSFVPLFTLAGIYLVLVIGLTTVVKRIEGRLRRSDSH